MFLFGYKGPLHTRLQNPVDCELPVFDLTSKKTAITGSNGKPRARVRPLPASSTLDFNIWKLAHAVKKAECTIPLSPGVANVSALGFVLDNAHLFHWPTVKENFRLQDQAIGVLDDFSQSGFAGRLGQGLCLLFMESQGFDFATRFRTYCAASTPRILTTHVVPNKRGRPTTVQLATPDFVCETLSGNRAIAESKGGFVSSNQSADIKGALREGLEQIGTWGTMFSPQITRNYAICTFLREHSDFHPEPSLLAWADPDGIEGNHKVPEDFVWRENYAAWLDGMGYEDVANSLRIRQEWSNTRFHITDIGGIKVAISIIGMYTTGQTWIEGAVVTGVRLDVLQSIRTGLRPTLPVTDPIAKLDGSETAMAGSFLKDGTYLGLAPSQFAIEEIDI